MTDMNLDNVNVKTANVTAVVGDKEISAEIKDKNKNLPEQAKEVLPL